MAIRSDNNDWLKEIDQPDCCILGKLSHPDKKFCSRILVANLAAISVLKARKTPILVTYSDNLADNTGSPVAMLYRSLLWHADGVVYPCSAMQKLGQKWTNHRLPPREWIIEDPWQVERQSYCEIAPGEPLRIIWFGHISNAVYLLRDLPKLLKHCNTCGKYELTILGEQTTQIKAMKIIDACQTNKPWKARFVNWKTDEQPEQLATELKRAHVAIIPSDPEDVRKSAASHNRAVDAIQAGCMVVTSPLESYIELRKLLLITENPAATINAATRQYSRLINKWAKHREELMNRFSPEVNISKWQVVLKELSEKV